MQHDLHPTIAAALAPVTPPKLREVDLVAARNYNEASSRACAAAATIAGVGQVFEAETIVLAHALQCAIERSHNMHMQRWKVAAEMLTDLQAMLAEEMRLDAEWRADRAEVA